MLFVAVSRVRWLEASGELVGIGAETSGFTPTPQTVGALPD